MESNFRPEDTLSLGGEPPAPRYLYVDETALDLPDGRRVLGVGALAVSAPIPPAVVDSALEALANDPDRDPCSDRFDPRIEKLDQATLRRGCFHASFDSMNAHSPLARQIKARVTGEFLCSFADAGSQADEREFRLHAMNSILPTLKTRSPVICVFEQRSGLSQISAREILDRLYAALDWSAYDLPMLRSYYSSVNVRVAPKAEAGLQVVDLLLWALAQSKFQPTRAKAKIAGRCGLHAWADGTIQGETTRWLECYLNRTVELDGDASDSLALYPVNRGDLEHGMDNSALANIYCLVERIVRAHAKGNLPEHARHLLPEIVATLRDLQDPRTVGPDQIRRVATQFLRLFDMVPIYAGLPDDHPDWVHLVRAKRYMGLTQRAEVVHGLRTSDFLAGVRRANVERNPSAFGLLAEHSRAT